MSAAKTLIPKEIYEHILGVEKLKYCYECGICTSSCPMAKLLGSEYNPRVLLEKIVLDSQKALGSEALWLCAWCYRCRQHCNQSLKLPEIFLPLRKIAAHNGENQSFEAALRKIAEEIPLPMVATLACFHPERAGFRREEILEKIWDMYQEHLKREKAKRAQQVSEEKVAIIGSGPAGLTVAYELSRKGYGVTVFEALSEAGGMLRKCLPDFRLPRSFLEREIQSIKDMGVEIRTNAEIGKETNFNGLWREGYRAVFIGVGAHKAQQLKIEGTELRGVVHALDFLWNTKSGKPAEVGKNIIVIGGGNVAVDASRVALSIQKARQGVASVVVLYRRSREEMPAIPYEVEEAENEGVRIQFLASPKSIVGIDGKVSAIDCLQMELGEPDESGRRRALPIAGSEFRLETDMVILALGETPDVGFLPEEVALEDSGTVCIDPFTMETSLKGVFAGGDAVTGPATVIEAICEGRRAAGSIDRYLRSLRGL